MFSTEFLYIGTLTPDFLWKTFPNPGVNSSSLRIVFEGLDETTIRKVWSTVLFRRRIPTIPDDSYTRPFIVNPTLDPIVINNEFKYFQDLGWVVYDWQVKLKVKKRRLNVDEPIYSLSLYEA